MTHDSLARSLLRYANASQHYIACSLQGSFSWKIYRAFEIPRRGPLNIRHRLGQMIGSLEAYHAAKTAAAMADFSSLGKIIFRGPDSHRFLHGLLTQDIQALAREQGLPVCVLTPKGKLVAYFHLYDRSQDLLALCHRGDVSGIAKALSMAMPLSKTAMEDASDSLDAVYLQGPKAKRILGPVLGNLELKPFGCAAISWESGASWALAYPIYGSEGMLIVGAKEELSKLRVALTEAGKSEGFCVLDAAALEILRVEAGVPKPGADYDADVYPLELGLEPAISFTKGCYMGQETTAHMKNRGHVNRRLAGVRAPTPLSTGAEVLADGKSVGRVTSAVQSPRLNAFLGLALIRLEREASGASIAISTGSVVIAAELVSLPVS